MGRDPKPTPQSRTATATAANRHQATPTELYHRETGHVTGYASSEAAAAFYWLLTRDDGYLRVMPDNDGATVYWKWKYTGGKYVNHYVMVVYPASESTEALLMLASKVNAVDRGEKRPVKDHYFQR